YGDFDIRRAMTINGNGSVVDAGHYGRVFDIRVPSGTVTLNNLSVQNGSWDQGAGIYVQGGLALALRNVDVSFNQTITAINVAGGGLYGDMPGGTLTVTGGSFLVNQAIATPGTTSKGGAIYFKGGLLNIDGTRFDHNQAKAADGNSGGDGGAALGGAL